jgi:beta-N-acetylhexosaminidase
VHFRLVSVAAFAVAPLVVGSVTLAAAAAPSHTVAQTVRATLAKMTLPEKVGQLFVDYVYGDTASTTNPADIAQNQAAYGVDTPAEVVAKYHLGGVIYFTWSDNLNSPTQIAGLSDGLQRAALGQDPPAPLLISTDQEGGNVVRLSDPVAVSPGNMAIGATFSATTSFQTAAATAAQLRALGINTDDAPVIDVNTNPANAADGPRAFGDNTPAAAALGVAAIAGYQSHGVSATAKHFPGLGSTTVNTDNGVAVTDETRAQIFARDIPPFQAAIAAGTDEIMAAHIVAPALDPSNTPASLSQPIVTGVLRDKLHYNGVVITDALSAAALGDVPAPHRPVGDQGAHPQGQAWAVHQSILDRRRGRYAGPIAGHGRRRPPVHHFGEER